MTLRVGILRSRDDGLLHGEERDALAVRAVDDQASAVAEACRANGWHPIEIEATRDPRTTLAAIDAARTDVVFQLAESIGGDTRLEAAAAWLLEWARVAYTGNGPLALSIALQKPMTRAVLAARGVPIAEGFVIERLGQALPASAFSRHGTRWIVKPAREDASHGIDLASVVTTRSELIARAEYVIERYRQPALVEEFVDGREFNVSLLGSGDEARVLPLSEIDFSRFPAGAPRLVTFAAKWDPASPEYEGTPAVAARDVPLALDLAIQDVARRAYNALDLRSYGRVDLRVHPERGPLVLDVNPNPDISPDAGLPRAAERAGISYAELIARFVDDARHHEAEHLEACPLADRIA